MELISLWLAFLLLRDIHWCSAFFACNRGSLKTELRIKAPLSVLTWQRFQILSSYLLIWRGFFCVLYPNNWWGWCASHCSFKMNSSHHWPWNKLWIVLVKISPHCTSQRIFMDQVSSLFHTFNILCWSYLFKKQNLWWKSLTLEQKIQ